MDTDKKSPVRKVHAPKLCKECSSEFNPWRRDRLFCSFSCKKKHNGRLWMRKKRPVYVRPTKEESIKKRMEYVRFRANRLRRTNVNHRILDNLRRRIRHALNGVGAKSDRTVELLGCSVESFKLYLESRFESGMSWQNYGEVWEIDHIMPCDIFDLTKPEHQRRCFHFSNMRPLPVTINRRKKAKVITDQYGLL